MWILKQNKCREAKTIADIQACTWPVDSGTSWLESGGGSRCVKKGGHIMWPACYEGEGKGRKEINPRLFLLFWHCRMIDWLNELICLSINWLIDWFTHHRSSDVLIYQSFWSNWFADGRTNLLADEFADQRTDWLTHGHGPKDWLTDDPLTNVLTDRQADWFSWSGIVD